MASRMTWSVFRLAIFGVLAGGAIAAVPVAYRGARNLAEPFAQQYAQLLGSAMSGTNKISIQPVTPESKQERRTELVALKTKLGQPRSSAERVETARNLRQAQSRLRLARKRVVDGLSTDAGYAAAVAAVRDSERALDGADAAANSPSESSRFALAEKRLALRTAVTTREARALAADAEYQTARKAMTDAATALARADAPARAAPAETSPAAPDKQSPSMAEIGRMLSALRPNE
jgi:hypothetical protein